MATRKPIGKREAARIAKMWIASICIQSEPHEHFDESGLSFEEIELVTDALDTLSNSLCPEVDFKHSSGRACVDAILAKRK